MIIGIDIGGTTTDIVGLKEKLKNEQSDKKRNTTKAKMLEDHEYDPDCHYCCENPFVKDALVAEANISENNKIINTIQDSIDAAGDKWTVNIARGTYIESLFLNSPKTVSLTGVRPSLPRLKVIVSASAGSTGEPVAKIDDRLCCGSPP